MKWTWWEDKRRRPWLVGGGVLALLLVLLLLGRDGEEEIPETSQAGSSAGQRAATVSVPTPVPAPAAESASLQPGAGASGESTRAENQRPQVTAIRLAPALIYPGTQVTAEVVASDPEEQEVTLVYQWRRNGEAIPEATNREYTVEGLLKGDLLQVTVTPYDGEQEGQAVNSVAAVIMNRPPTITSFPPTGLDDGRFRYAVQAADPDGDPLIYALVESPPGMTVDAQTGLVEWAAAATASGTFQVRLTVFDGDATTYQAFSLKLTQP